MLFYNLNHLFRGNGTQLSGTIVHMVFFHRDEMFPDGTKEKQVIEFNDLDAALTYAEQDLKDRWEYYKNRFLRGFKNDK